jgi:hypothetical protein
MGIVHSRRALRVRPQHQSTPARYGGRPVAGRVRAVAPAPPRELLPAEAPQEVRDAVAANEAFYAPLYALQAWQPDEGAGAAVQRIVDVLCAWTLYDVGDGFVFPPDDPIWAAAGAAGGLPAALAAPAAAAPPGISEGERDFLWAALIAASGARSGAEGPARWWRRGRTRRGRAARRPRYARWACAAPARLFLTCARSRRARSTPYFTKRCSPAPRARECAAAERAAALNPRSAKVSNFWAGLFSASNVRRCHDIASAAAARFAALRWEWITPNNWPAPTCPATRSWSRWRALPSRCRRTGAARRATSGPRMPQCSLCRSTWCVKPPAVDFPFFQRPVPYLQVCPIPARAASPARPSASARTGRSTRPRARRRPRRRPATSLSALCGTA